MDEPRNRQWPVIAWVAVILIALIIVGILLLEFWPYDPGTTED